MSFDPNRYTHNADRAALKALRAIPGFPALTKGFMNLWNERQQKILNMSSRIRLGEKQMKHYYDMLPPVCEKLGIAVPELYVELNIAPNAYTSGDTNPYIVLTSGLLEMLPDELIPTVLAHECGHIACHHVLYQTMGAFVLNGASAAISRYLPMGNLLTVPLQIAFYYWMRCSEFTCDRAAVLCDGTAEKQQEVCMRLAGLGGKAMAEANMEEFLKQAESYTELIDSSAWNKTLEFLILQGRTHPLMALRATECGKWAASEEFDRIIRGLPPLESPGTARIADIPVSASMQVCRIGEAGICLQLPERYELVRSMPEDPPESVTYALTTDESQILVTVWPRQQETAVEFENRQKIIDGIHETLEDDQGLIEVSSGETKAGRKYISSIVKTVMNENGASKGTQYCLMADIGYPDSVVSLKGFFGENGVTGLRDRSVFEFVQKEKKVFFTEDGVLGWSRDPYDPAFTRGIPMNLSEHPAYDELFPGHPLSEARKFLAAVIENN